MMTTMAFPRAGRGEARQGTGCCCCRVLLPTRTSHESGRSVKKLERSRLANPWQGEGGALIMAGFCGFIAPKGTVEEK